jgi:ligand-binding SRPBCC domain-containing protein
MADFTVTRKIAAPAEKVWTIAGDFMKSPGPGVEVKVEKRGNGPNGIGAERTITIGSVCVRERLESVDPGRSFSYTILSGAPMKDHRATAAFTADGASTEISWNVAFTPKIPGTGWVVAMVTKKAINRYLDVVAKAAR